MREKGKHKTVAFAFSGSSSTLPAFINRPDGLQHDLVRSKNGWKQVATGSPAPRARAHHPLVYSEGWNALFVYSGYTNDAVNGTGLFTPENYLGGSTSTRRPGISSSSTRPADRATATTRS